jgi:proteasome alpha subunit
MLTPFDWQEGIGHRAQYVESRLSGGMPVVACSLKSGILVATVRRQARKVFEVYDRLVFSAIGQQSDVESLRVAAIEFAHREGYQRSEQDVTIQRMVAALSQPVKRAFGDMGTSPFVARSLFAEINGSIDEDRFYVIDYDGDYVVEKNCAIITGSGKAQEAAVEAYDGLKVSDKPAEKALEELKKVLAAGIAPEGETSFDEAAKDYTLEAAIMDREPTGERRFRLLAGQQD